MSLNLGQLRILQADWLQSDHLVNFRGPQPSTADANAQINYALRMLSHRLFLFNPSVALTLTANQSLYNLRDAAVVSQPVVEPMYVVVNGTPLGDRWNRAYGLWSLTELDRSNPSWRGDANGTPTLAVWLGNNGSSASSQIGNMILYPKPTGTVANAGASYVAAQVLAPALSSDGDIPAIPDEAHETIAILAAIYAAYPTTTEQGAWQRLQAFGSYTEMIEKLRGINLQAALSNGTSTPTMRRWMLEMDDKDRGDANSN